MHVMQVDCGGTGQVEVHVMCCLWDGPYRKKGSVGTAGVSQTFDWTLLANFWRESLLGTCIEALCHGNTHNLGRTGPYLMPKGPCQRVIVSR
jgi:hypothetical protein